MLTGGVDSLGTCIIDFYIEHMDFTRVYWPPTGIITMRMHVSLAKFPLHTVMHVSLELLWCICSHSLFHQVMSAFIPRGHGAGCAYSVMKAPG
jgi:hypothetical protein